MRTSVPVPDILSPEHHADPHASYEVLREEYPVVFHEGTGAWLVSRHEDCMTVLKSKVASTENYSWQIEPVHGRTIINMDGKEHTTHRRLLTPFFHREGLDAFKPEIRAAAQRLLDPLVAEANQHLDADGRATVDLHNSFNKQYPISVIEAMLDLPTKDHAAFEGWYTDIMGYIGNLAGEEELFAKGLQARAEMTEYFLPLIEQRRSADGTDLLTQMCQADVEGSQLSDEEVRAFISLMLTAGGETTDRALGNMMVRLIEHPDQLRAVYEDRSLVLDAFAETMRHTGPVHVSGRYALEDIELAGVTIPEGSTITCLISSANHDPRRFERPDEFDIFREDNDTARAFSANSDHLGFIAGRHFCVGAMLAKTEVEFGFNEILDRMGDIRFADGFVPVHTGLFTRGVDELLVSYVPR